MRTSIAAALLSVLVGFHVSDRLSLEPRLSVNAISSDGNSITTLQLGGAVLVAPSETLFLYGEGGANRVGLDIGGSSDAAIQAYLGGGVGFRKALDDRYGLRWELGARYLPETDDAVSQTVFSAVMGFSFFTSSDGN